MPDNQRLCNYCQQYKAWVWSGKHLKDGSKVYIDEKSIRWAGKRCPDCEKKRIRAALKCSPPEKALIIAELKKQGFNVLSSSFPLKVEREGKHLSVGLRYASTHNGKIVLAHDDISEKADMFAIFFQSVRIFPRETLQKLNAQTSSLESTR